MHIHWRGKVWRYIVENSGGIVNLFEPRLGHIGYETLKRVKTVDIERENIEEVAYKEILDRLLRKYISIDHEYIPIPLSDIDDVTHYFHTAKSKGITFYTLPWYNTLNELYTLLLRPIYKIPVDESMEPQVDKLNYNYEYGGVYHLTIPDTYTGKAYLDLLKKYTEMVLEFGGDIFIDITYGHLLPRDLISRISKIVEPVVSNTFFYIDISRSISSPIHPISLLYIPMESYDKIISYKKPFNLKSIDSVVNDILNADISWNVIIDEIIKTLDERVRILEESISVEHVSSRHNFIIKDEDNLETADRLLYENKIIVEPIDVPMKGISLNLYTNCSRFEYAVDTISKEYS